MERPRAPRRAGAILCPHFTRLWRHMLEIRGGFRVLRQQSESADNRSNTAGQDGAIVNQAVRPSSAGESDGAETPATKTTSEAKKHWLDYATAFLTLAAAGGAITAAVFTGWQARRPPTRAYGTAI